MKDKKFILGLYGALGLSCLVGIIINSIKFSRSESTMDSVFYINNILSSGFMILLLLNLGQETIRNSQTINNVSINFAENSRVSGIFNVEMKRSPTSSSDLLKTEQSSSPT